MTIYNFQVCEKFHNTRTRALYNTICKKITEKGERFYLISGFRQKDDMPLLKLTHNDDYMSAIDKTLQCFLYHFLHNTEFEYFFYGDDDTFINFRNLDNFIYSLDVSLPNIPLKPIP